MKKTSKFVALPLLAMVALGMSACDRSDWVADEPAPSPETVTSETVEDTSGGVGMTYTGKMGIDMGNGLVLPMGGTSPQLGYGF